MTKTLAITLLAFMGAVSAGCGTEMQAEKAAANAPTANVAGKWSGYTGSGGASAPVTMTLQQNGTKVTGDLSVGGRPDLSGPVTGTVQGELVSVSLATTSFAQMRVQQDSMSGEGSAGPVRLQRSK